MREKQSPNELNLFLLYKSSKGLLLLKRRNNQSDPRVIKYLHNIQLSLLLILCNISWIRSFHAVESNVQIK